MRLTTKYALAGALWGLALGYGVAAASTGLGVAFLWLIVYGDQPWAESTASLLYFVALGSVLVSIVFCAAVGYRFGWKMERHDAERRAREHQRASLASIAAVIVMALGGYQLYAQDRAMSTRQAFLAALLESVHRIHSIDLREDGGAEIRVGWSSSGKRLGPYRLEVRVTDERLRVLSRFEEQIAIDQAEIYRSLNLDVGKLLGQMAPPTMSDGLAQRRKLGLQLRLTPILERAELRRMPRHAAEQYLAEDSPFHDVQRREFAVETLFRDGRFGIESRQGWLLSSGP